MDEPEGTVTPDQPGQVSPEEINQIFDSADLQATVMQLAISVDRQRRQLILMWVAVLGLAGALTFLTVQGLRDA
jgi:hypothetical protein